MSDDQIKDLHEELSGYQPPPEPLIHNPSVVREVRVEGSDVMLRIQLYDYVAPPPIPEPVLNLTLHDVVSGAAELTSTLNNAAVWDIEKSATKEGLTLTFCDDMGEIASVRCSRISSVRRPFEEADWLDLVESYERWARRDRAELRRLNRATGDLEVALTQQMDRARRIIEQSEGRPERLAKASARLQTLEEIANVLRAGLDQ